MFFSLDANDFGKMYGDLQEGYRFMEGAVNSMAYFANEGGGRFTPLVSKYYVGFLREAIDRPYILNPMPHWPKKKSKRYLAKTGPQRWKVTGMIQQSIDVIWRGRHTQTVGIRRDIMRDRDYGDPISVAATAKFLEWGTIKMQEAPLFQPALQTFVNQNWPKLTWAIEQCIAESTKEYGRFKGKRSISRGEQLKAANPSRDFSGMATMLARGPGYVSKRGKNFIIREVSKSLSGENSANVMKELK
jgi:hypothetical protein